MDMEQLSKSQIVLLTLLVSFVTSMATGIVAVSLMDQAPPAIAQTVNRVIERTVEKVAAPAVGNAPPTIVTQEKTVVVKESDLVAQALAKASPSVVRLYSDNSSEAAFLGLGLIIDSTGVIVSDESMFGERGDAVTVLSDGSRVRSFVTSRSKAGVAFLRSASTTIDGKEPRWNPASLAVSQAPLGTAIVVIAGRSTPRIESGMISSVIQKSDAMQSAVIDTDLAPANIAGGSPIVDTNGAIVGFSTGVSRAIETSAFVPATSLIPSTAASAK